MSEYRKAKKGIEVSVGESVRILRELQEMSQNDLATATGIAQSTLSAIENDRVRLGVERAKVLARALRCHPAVLVFPAGIWDKTPPRNHRDLLFLRPPGRVLEGVDQKVDQEAQLQRQLPAGGVDGVHAQLGGSVAFQQRHQPSVPQRVVHQKVRLHDDALVL